MTPQVDDVSPADSDRRGIDLRNRWRLIAAVVVTVAAVGWWYGGDRGPQPPKVEHRDDPPGPQSVESQLLTAVVNANPGYVGVDVCRECHAKRYDEFCETRHFAACRAAESGRMPSGFTTEPVSLSSPNWPMQFQMTTTGEKWQQTVLLNSGASAEPQSYSIDLIYGSQGQADEVFFTWQENRLYELPLAWLHTERKWAKQAYDDIGEAVLRATTPRCLECHTTFFEHVLGTENEYRRESLMLGVTCERCHGPGRDHVAYHRAHPAESVGNSIVRPAQLSRDRQIDLCAQCHSNAIFRRGPLFSYLPGEPLEKHFRSLLAEGVENDHVADQTKYMRRSKCFQQSDTMTCTTCHHPHRPADPQVIANACVACHPASDCREQQRLPAEVRHQCVDCHMPKHDRVAVKFHSPDEQDVFPMRPHQHRIAVYPAARQEVLRDWYQRQSDAESQRMAAELGKSLAEFWRGEADRLRQDHRFVPAIAAYREAQRAVPSESVAAALRETLAIQAKLIADAIEADKLLQTGKHSQTIALLEEMLAVSPNAGRIHGSLGTAYELVGRHDQAVEHWDAVARCDPDNPYGHNMLGWTAYLRGNWREAADGFRKADEIYPWTAEIQYRWGLALMQLDDRPQATERFRNVLKINPRHPGACQGLSHVLRRDRQFDEAVSLARRAAELTRFENLDMLISLLDAYADNGQSAEAAETLRLAIERARAQRSPLLTALLSRQAEFSPRTAK